MSDSTGIEWADATWNPVTGCTRVSPGCAHCYIERTPPFRMEGRRFTHGADGATTGVRLHPERLGQPLMWRKPRRVFVNSLSDLFHEEIDYHFIREVFNVMRRCDGGIVAATGKANPSHVFQVLTKRPEKALQLWRDRKLGFVDWPPNVWLGVSIENARFTYRADVLRQIPAAIRFISAEPLLGSLYPKEEEWTSSPTSRSRSLPYERGFDGVSTPSFSASSDAVHADATRLLTDGATSAPTTRTGKAPLDLTGIDWVIVGGESGPGARPMHHDWARELRDGCLDVCGTCLSHEGIQHECRRRPAFFFKQWGEWTPFVVGGIQLGDVCLSDDGERYDVGRDYVCAPNESDGAWLRRVGKRRAGRVLDGRYWDEMPVMVS